MTRGGHLCPVTGLPQACFDHDSTAPLSGSSSLKQAAVPDIIQIKLANGLFHKATEQ